MKGNKTSANLNFNKRSKRIAGKQSPHLGFMSSRYFSINLTNFSMNELTP